MNLGFDLFRIIPGWRTTEKVAHEAKDIPFMMKNPTLYGVVNFGKAIAGNKFEFIDQKLQDSFQDDLFFPDDMPEKEIAKLSKLFSKKGETLFEQEGWQIVDTELYFEANIKIIKSNKYPL